MHILNTPTLGLHLPLQEETDFLHGKKSPFGAGEVAQGMKRLDVLAEDQVQYQFLHSGSQPSVTPAPSNPHSSDQFGYQAACGAYTCVEANLKKLFLPDLPWAGTSGCCAEVNDKEVITVSQDCADGSG